MKKITLIIIVFLSSCGKPYDGQRLESFRAMYKELEKADYNFSSGYQYYRMENQDLYSITDTIVKYHSDIFQDKEIEKAANDNITEWLRDSVFIGSSQTTKGTFILDTTNMLLLEKPFEYYMQLNITTGQDIQNKIFQLPQLSHTVTIGDKKLFYEIIPVNGTLIKEIAEFRIITSGDYIPEYMPVGGKNTKANLRYFCDLYSIDWYIVIMSDDFFKGELAIKIVDKTYYYSTRKK